MSDSMLTTTRVRLVLFLLFAAALLGNYLRFSLVFGLDFLFGSIAVLIAVYNFGTRWGVAVAFIASLYTWWLWGHPYAMILFVGEALFVGLALRRSGNMLLLDGIYWLFVGMPLAWLLYYSVLGQGATQTGLVMLKDAVNGIFNALVASLLVTHTPLRSWPNHARRERLVPLDQAVFNLCVGCVLLPVLLLLFIGSRQSLENVQQQIKDDLLTQSEEAANTFEIWQQLHLSALKRLARSAQIPENKVPLSPANQFAGENLQQETALLAQSFPDFRAIIILEESGRTLASYGAQSPDGRRYSSVLEDHAKSELRGPGRAGRLALGRVAEIPVVLITEPLPAENSPDETAGDAPVQSTKAAGGIVAAVLDVSFINRWLQRSLPTEAVDVSVVNASGKIVASTHEYSDRRQIVLPIAQNGQMQALGNALFHWFPAQGNRTAVERWAQSIFVREIPLRGTDWKLLLETPLGPHQVGLNAIYLNNLMLVMILLVATLLMASILSRGLTSPLSRLAQQTTDLPSRVLQGEPTGGLRQPRSSMMEIDILVRNFQSMSETLQKSFGEREEVNHQLGIEQQRLTEANRLKDEFLAILSHELRTPLVPIIGYADLISRGVLKDDDVGEGARSIERNARAQLRLIEDLLDVSRIITGKLSLRTGTVELARLIRESLDTVKLSAQAKDIKLLFEEREEITPILGDEARLRQVIWNLLSNAVKFTSHDGHIRVVLERHDGMAQITVSDNGIGIAPEFLPFVFDRFRQAGDHLTRSSGGLGLGLAIVRHLAELHGGTITAHSEGEGQGAMFILRLPLRQQSETPSPQIEAPAQTEAPEKTKQTPIPGPAADVAPSPQPQPQPRAQTLTAASRVPSSKSSATPKQTITMKKVAMPRLEGARVLVIDDEADGRQMLMAMLRTEGAEVFEADSAREALRVVQESTPNAIVCDVGMPAMDGYDFLRALRERAEFAAIPVIAFTAYAGAHDKEKVLASGFEAYLSKPADAPEVATVLQMLIERH